MDKLSLHQVHHHGHVHGPSTGHGLSHYRSSSVSSNDRAQDYDHGNGNSHGHGHHFSQNHGPGHLRKRKRSDNWKHLPKRVILVRHGESLGNADSETYATIPDWKIPLTATGEQQARNTGLRIKELIDDEPLSVFCSPYLRTKQTLKHVMSVLPDNPVLTLKEDPRLTEQQFGNFQSPDLMTQYKSERKSFGRFYYRFPQGESGLDVYNRVTSFIASLFRDWDKEKEYPVDETNVLIVTHGLTLRLFLMRWYQFSVHEFEASENPDNAAIVVMTRADLVKLAYSHSHSHDTLLPSLFGGECSASSQDSSDTATNSSQSSNHKYGILPPAPSSSLSTTTGAGQYSAASALQAPYFMHHSQNVHHNFVIDDATLQSMNLKATVSSRHKLFSEILSRSIPTTPATPASTGSTGSEKRRFPPEGLSALTHVGSNNSISVNTQLPEPSPRTSLVSPHRVVFHPQSMPDMGNDASSDTDSVVDGLMGGPDDNEEDSCNAITEQQQQQQQQQQQIARLQSLAQVSMAVLLKETDCNEETITETIFSTELDKCES